MVIIFLFLCQNLHPEKDFPFCFGPCICRLPCGNSHPWVYLWPALTCWQTSVGVGQQRQDVRVETVVSGEPIFTSDHNSPFNLLVHLCSVQQQASVTGTPHAYFFFFLFECQRENQETADVLPHPQSTSDEWNPSKKPALCGRLLQPFADVFGWIISSVNLLSVNRAEQSVENYNKTCEPWRFLFLSRRW